MLPTCFTLNSSSCPIQYPLYSALSTTHPTHLVLRHLKLPHYIFPIPSCLVSRPYLPHPLLLHTILSTVSFLIRSFPTLSCSALFLLNRSFPSPAYPLSRAVPYPTQCCPSRPTPPRPVPGTVRPVPVFRRRSVDPTVASRSRPPAADRLAAAITHTRRRKSPITSQRKRCAVTINSAPGNRWLILRQQRRLNNAPLLSRS